MMRDGVPIGDDLASASGRGALPPTNRDRTVAPNVRGPGGDRHRERPPVHGAGGAESRPHRGPGAADSERRRSCGVISSSPSDVQPVLPGRRRERDTVSASAFDAVDRSPGGKGITFCVRAHYHGPIPVSLRGIFFFSGSRSTALSESERAVMDQAKGSCARSDRERGRVSSSGYADAVKAGHPPDDSGRAASARGRRSIGAILDPPPRGPAVHGQASCAASGPSPTRL